MTTHDLTTVAPEVERDRFGRPLIIQPDGKKKAYTRATTLAGTLDDTYNLSRWQQRMVAIGLADRPDLLLAVTAHRDDKSRLNQLCEDALEAAKGRAAATTGTAVHALTEFVDRGRDLPVVPDGAAADLEAYRIATAGMEHLTIEQMMVLDDIKVAGTPDRITRYRGGTYITDLKTGSIDWSAAKIAMQLALYSRAVGYDVRTGERFDLPEVDQDRALVIHLPAGEGRCTLHWIDIARGWERVQTALDCREWRKAKGLLTPVEIDLSAAIEQAPTVEALTALWRSHETQWTDEHTQLASARKAALQQAA